MVDRLVAACLLVASAAVYPFWIQVWRSGRWFVSRSRQRDLDVMPDGKDVLQIALFVLGVLFVDAFLVASFFSGFPHEYTATTAVFAAVFGAVMLIGLEGLFAFLLVSSHEWEAAHAESDYARAVRAVVRHGTRAVEATSAAPGAPERERAAAAIRGLEARLSAGRPLYPSWEADAYLRGVMTAVGDAEFGEPHQARLTVALQSAHRRREAAGQLISYLESH